MLKLYLLILLLTPIVLPAQKRVPLPHGITFGKKVDELQNIPAAKLEDFIGNKIRISTTITGKVLQVDTPKGGWLQLDAGGGKIIRVHFKDYNVFIPKQLKGRNVMIQGVAQKLLIADDMQHFAGENVDRKKQNAVKPDAKQRLTFEAWGLMVE
jgi:hypothetical protein